MERAKQNPYTRPLTVWVLATVCGFLWGSASPCIKLGYQAFSIPAGDPAGQILFAGVRFFLAGAVIVLCGSLRQKKLLFPRSGGDWGRVALLSLAQTSVLYFFFYIGTAHTTGVNASIIQATGTFAAILLSGTLFRQETLTARKLLGCAVGFAGVVVINLGGLSFHFDLLGDGFVFIASISSGLANILIKRYSQHMDNTTLIGWQYVLGGGVMTLGALLAGGRIRPASPWALPLLCYLVFISSVARVLWGLLLKHNPVSRISMYGLMKPIFGVLLSSLLLGELSFFGWGGLAALALVCGGIVIVSRPSPDKEVSSQ